MSGVVIPAEAYSISAGGCGGVGCGGGHGRSRGGGGRDGGAKPPAGLDLETEVLVRLSRCGDVCVVGFEVLVCIGAWV